MRRSVRRRDRIRPLTLAAAGAVVVAVALGAAPISEPETDWSRVDSVFAEYDRSNAPGCALGVVRDGRLEYGRGYGMANLDHGIAITPQTVFRTGSVGKQFTAAAIAIAARDGTISLDDPVRRWIPELPRYAVDPTVRQVVHHTSGLRDYLTLMSLRGLRDDDYYTPEDVREVIGRQRALNFTPGSEYLYSNSGYFLLGEIIREATGMTLDAYAQERIFGPLGMTHSHFHDDHNHVVPLRATGYAPTEGGYRVSATTLDMVGDGGVFTSVEDLALWVDALNEDRLSEGLSAMLETVEPLTDGTPNAYAFGQRVGQYRGVRTVSHSGAFVGFRAAITRFPDRGTSIVVACNRSDAAPSSMALHVADVVLADELGPEDPPASPGGGRGQAEDPPPVPVVDPTQYAGTFHSEELDVDYRLVVEDGVLTLKAGSSMNEELLQIGPDHLAAGGLRLRFSREGGRVVSFQVDAGRVKNLAFVRGSSGPGAVR